MTSTDHLRPLTEFPAPQWFGDIIAECRAAMASPEWRGAPMPPLSLLLPVSQRREKRRRQRKPTLASVVAKAKQLGIDVTVEPNGAVTFHTGTVGAPVDKPQTELDEWIAKHAH